ncbi:MAG: PspC domain-containing protein [Siphonobacter sp.]
MKKTISITIAGVVFYIEEDGYDRLQGYLESIKRYFANYEGSAEIIEDIEARIAEKFYDKLKKEDKQAITADDVDELVRAMGTVADFEAIEEEEDFAGMKAPLAEPVLMSGGSSSSSNTTAPTNKRLYRDTKRKVLGGVCAGIAHYLNVDPLWVRLATLALFIGSPIFGGITDLGEIFGPLSGFIFIIYIACWVSFPANANLEEDEKLRKLYRDPEHKALAGVAAGVAAYTGWDLGLVRFVWVLSILFFGTGLILYLVLWAITPPAKTLTDRMKMQGEPITLTNIETNIKKTLNIENQSTESTLTKVLLFPFRVLGAVFEGLVPMFGFTLVLLRVLAGVIMIVIGVSGLFGILGALGLALGISGLDNIVHFGNTPLNLLHDASPWMFIFGALATAVPAIAVGIAGLSLLTKQNYFRPVVWQSLLGIFLIGVIGSGVMIPQYLANFARRGTIEKTVFLKSNHTPTFDAVTAGDEEYHNTNLTLEGYDGTEIKLIQEFSSRGRNRTEAEKLASQLSYWVNSKDSSLVFDRNFGFPEHVPFRNQELRMKLYIPYEMPFSMTEDFAKFVTNHFSWVLFDKDQFPGSLWKFTRDGELLCLNRTIPQEENQDDDENYESTIGRGIPKTYPVGSFSKIDISGGFAVEVKQGSEYRVTVYAENERRLDDVEVRVQGNTLKIDRKNKLWNALRNRGITSIRIEMPSLEGVDFSGAVSGIVKGFDQVREIELSGACQATFTGIQTSALDVDVAGAATLTLLGTAQNLNADISGASTLDAYSLKTNAVVIEVSGASNAKVYSKEKLRATATGASEIDYKGPVKDVEESQSGGSSINRSEGDE